MASIPTSILKAHAIRKLSRRLSLSGVQNDLELRQCCSVFQGVCAPGKTSALHASGRALSMPGPPFDDLMTELGGTCEEETPLSVELTTLDMQLPSMELTPDMQGDLLSLNFNLSCQPQTDLTALLCAAIVTSWRMRAGISLRSSDQTWCWLRGHVVNV